MAKLTERKRLVKKLDGVFSFYIRLRDRRNYGTCPFCRVAAISQCFHFITRAKYATRWDSGNAVGSCAGCNFKMEFQPAEFHQWFIEKYGKVAWDAMITRSHQIAKLDNQQLKDKITMYSKALEGLCLK